MTSAAEFDQAVRNFLASVPSGERIETLALATTLLVQLNDPRPIEDARAIIRAEAFLCKRRSTRKHAGYTAMAVLGGGGNACEQEVFHEKAFSDATRSRNSFRRPIIGGYARVRLGRLRRKHASRRGRTVLLGRPKSSLVPKTHGPHSHSYAQWGDDLL
jgi:hypothetical protein